MMGNPKPLCQLLGVVSDIGLHGAIKPPDQVIELKVKPFTDIGHLTCNLLVSSLMIGSSSHMGQ